MTAAGIVLAAGLGTRFGGGKLLAQFDGRPLLQHVLDAAAGARLEPVVVVLGTDAARIAGALDWRNELRVVNPDPARGMASSLHVGLAELALLPEVERALVLLGDQPLVSVSTIERLLAEPADASRPLIVPRYADGQPGNPVRLDRPAWPLATPLTGDTGMSAAIGAHPELVRYVDVPGANPDVDTPADLAGLTRDAARARSFRTAAADRSTP